MQVEEENRLLELELRDRATAVTNTHEYVEEVLHKVDTASLFGSVLCVC